MPFFVLMKKRKALNYSLEKAVFSEYRLSISYPDCLGQKGFWNNCKNIMLSLAAFNYPPGCLLASFSTMSV